VRCAALAEAPYAFSSTLKDALQRSDEGWRQITYQYASHPNSLTYFAFADQDPCGMSACVANGEEVELFAVWVTPAYRRTGVGRALIDYGRAWAHSKGSARIRVGIFEDNPAALAFYRSVGFTDSGQIDPVLSTEERAVLLYTLGLA
jgi:ribosomal protein S18 acetylase RimI-like enzyme